MTLTRNVARSTFLDRYGRYAKVLGAVRSIRLELDDGTVKTLTTDEYNALTPDDRAYLMNLPSAHIDTEGKSNA